jgi:hypothetical protein
MPPKPDLTSDQRKQIVSQLLLLIKDGVGPPELKRGALKQVADNFNVQARTITAIWRRACQNYADPTIGAFRASPLKKNNCGGKQKYDRDGVRAAILLVPTHRRKSLRKIASAIGVSKSTMHRMKIDKDDNVIIPHSNAIRPTLRDDHQLARVLYSADNLDIATEQYHDYYDSVHVDEKWFFITEAQLRMYLVPGEAPPQRSVPHKSHIIKVMFLAAIARPRYDAAGECTFDGKIGMWPFVEYVPAQRNSVNRPAGTIETKSITVTKRVYRQYMIEKVLPAIKLKWPDRDREIVIQQDGPNSHIKENDAAFMEAAEAGNWLIRLLTQPAQSPDTNTLDLSFFRALQSAQWDHGFANTIDGLIAQVITAYEEFPPRKIDFGFITLQSCLDEILSSNGDNTYKIPHMGKERLLRDGVLPARVRASPQALAVARQVALGLGLDDVDEVDGDGDGEGDDVDGDGEGAGDA